MKKTIPQQINLRGIGEVYDLLFVTLLSLFVTVQISMQELCLPIFFKMGNV